MSRKRIPGRGKSRTSATAFFKSIMVTTWDIRNYGPDNACAVYRDLESYGDRTVAVPRHRTRHRRLHIFIGRFAGACGSRGWGSRPRDDAILARLRDRRRL